MRSRGFKNRYSSNDVDAGELQWLEDCIHIIGGMFYHSVRGIVLGIFALPVLIYACLRKR